MRVLIVTPTGGTDEWRLILSGGPWLGTFSGREITEATAKEAAMLLRARVDWYDPEGNCVPGDDYSDLPQETARQEDFLDSELRRLGLTPLG